MRVILLVSHGTMAEGVYKAAGMIYGEMPNVRFFCLEQNMGIEQFKVKLGSLIEEIKDADELVVLADLAGGSPYNAALDLISKQGMLDKSIVISGLNLPMLLTLLFTKEGPGKDTYQEVLEAGRHGIMRFEIKEKEEEETIEL